MPMATLAKRWTLDELHALPDDGNKYEVIRGELFVTPAPTPTHETVVARLTRILDAYVEREGLGLVYHPRAVLQFEDSEVEPDLMVRQEHNGDSSTWASAPIPSLIVEVFSPSTKRRDAKQKRDLYMEAGVGEYWMVDPERRVVIVIKPGKENTIVSDELSWHPDGATTPLRFQVARVFGSAPARPA
ncbi:MAG: Uma2 family endonuclease [Gemmatimonadota bacterium]